MSDGAADPAEPVRVFVRLAMTALSACAEPLSGLEYRMLALVSAEPHRAGLLAEHLEVSKAGVTKALTALEERGLVRRLPVAGDRRGVEAHITADGARVLTDVDDQFRRFFLRLGPPDEVERFLDAVVRLRPALDHELQRLSGDAVAPGPRLLPRHD